MTNQNPTDEDLEKSKRFLNKEEIENTIQGEESRKIQDSLKPFINRALEHSTYFMRESADPTLLQKLFPGMDISNIQEYDFSKSNIDILVLSEGDNERLNEEMRTLKDSAAKSIFGFEKPLLVLGFILPSKRDDISDEENLVLGQMTIIEMLNHELLHILGINSRVMAEGFKEGITELLAQSITKKDDYFAKYPQLHRYLPLGYAPVTRGINMLVNRLINNDIPLKTIIKAFGMGDRDSIVTVAKELEKIYGTENSFNIPKVVEREPERFDKYMEELEQKIKS
jgi:hypothetical protein